MKKTLKDEVIELLQTGWYSNYQINMIIKSSGADREMRRVRQNPPEGFYIDQRKKVMPAEYRDCLEYTLKSIDEKAEI